METYLQMAGKQLAKRKPKKLKKGIAPRYPASVEREYARALSKYVQVMSSAIQARLIPTLPSLVAQINFNRPAAVRADAVTDDVNAIFEGIDVMIEENYTPEEIAQLAKKFGVETSDFNRRIIKTNIKRVIGVDVMMGDAFLANELAMFVAFNTNLITSLKDDTMKKISSMVYTGFQNGSRAEDISTEIMKFIDPNVGNVRARANLIARDQVNKLNGQLTQLRQSDLGIERYRWRTMGDDRVRKSHEDHDGDIFSWDDPPSDTGHPGEDYQCRCYAEPVLEDLVPGLEPPESYNNPEWVKGEDGPE